MTSNTCALQLRSAQKCIFQPATAKSRALVCNLLCIKLTFIEPQGTQKVSINQLPLPIYHANSSEQTIGPLGLRPIEGHVWAATSKLKEHSGGSFPRTRCLAAAAAVVRPHGENSLLDVSPAVLAPLPRYHGRRCPPRRD